MSCLRRKGLEVSFISVLKVSGLSELIGNLSHGDNGCGGCSNWSENLQILKVVLKLELA